jgi:hypothetical protein
MIEADPLIILIACGILIAVFVRAVWHKVSDFAVFKATAADYRLLPHVLIAPLSLVLVIAEIAIIAGLIVPAARQAAAIGAVGLLLAYGLAIAANLMRGRYTIDCGCGGSGQGLSWFLVARNAVLAAISALAVASPLTRELSVTDAVVLGLSVLTVLLLLVAVEQTGANDAHRQFLRHSRGKG